MKTALIIGSAGFIGRHLLPALRESGWKTTVIDPCANGWLHEKDAEWIFSARFEDWHRELLGGSKIGPAAFDAVVHLAANIESIDRRTAGGAEQFADCELDLAVMRYLGQYPPKVYVHMSSCAVSYPEPTDPYCAVKMFGEAIARHVCKKAGIRLVLLRPFSGYGADQADSYPFPAILKRALNREDPLTVWGDGFQARDLVHVDDIVRAILHGIEGGFPDGVPVEIGTGRQTMMGTLAVMMADAVGYNPRIFADNSKPNGAPTRVMTSDVAAQSGFRADVALEEGIERTIRELEHKGA